MILKTVTKYERLVREVNDMQEGEERAVSIDGIPVVIRRASEPDHQSVIKKQFRCPD